MYIAILGRQPAIGIAELEALYGGEDVKWLSNEAALIKSDFLKLERLGGTQKAGRVTLQLASGTWNDASTKIIQHYTKKLRERTGKITFGISTYGIKESTKAVQKPGLILKQNLKKTGINLRLLPNAEPALSTATSHHNKLGLSENKIELIIVRATNGQILIAESIGAQNITAYARRDQGRPKRDAFVGMLPPKLAQIIINLAAGSAGGISRREHLQPEPSLMRSQGEHGAKPFSTGYAARNAKASLRLLDPFCGTGVILQEAALMGYDIYGTDLSEKMIDYSHANLEWLASTHRLSINPTLQQADATTASWQPPIDIVACESYLGQPFSAPPSPEKLAQVLKNCNHIISSFLANIGPQLQSGMALCIAVPAWRATDGSFTHLPLLNQIEKLGFTRTAFKNISTDQLLYYREDQVVARELLVLSKA